MSTSAGRVVLTFDVDDSGVVQGLGRVKGEVDKSTSTISAKAVAMGTAIGVAAGKLAVDAVKALGREFKDIAVRGVELAPVVTSFDNLTKAIGESGDQMLSVARTSTKGLITDLDLMAAANKAMQLGVPVTASSFGEMARMATTLGRAMNQDARKSLDDFIVAMGRSSTQILDNLGLQARLSEANDAYARSVGKTAAQLTDAERKLAFQTAAMTAAREGTDKLGEIQLTLAERIKAASNWTTNFTDSLGVAVATSPVINTAFDAIGEAIGGALGENQTLRVQMLASWVNKLAIGGVSTAQALVTGAGIIVRAWEMVKFAFAGVMTALFGLSEGVIKSFSTIVEAANKIPGVRGEFDALAAALRDDAAMAEGMRQSFQAQTAEAWEGVKGNSALGQTLGVLGERLDDMKARMIAAGRAQADTAEIARQLVGVQNEQAQSATAAAEAAKKLQQEIDRQRSALSSLGITTERDVNNQILEFQKLMARAAAEGVPVQRAMDLIIPKLVELRAKAIASGTSVEGLDSFLQGLRATVRDLNGPLPTMNAQLIQTFPRMDQLAGKVRIVTGEMLRQQTEVKLLGDAFETLGVTTQASLDSQVAAARLAYQRILDSGKATSRELQEARAAVEKAEIDAGLRTVSLWETQIQPAIEGAWRSITSSLSGNFTDMLTGATGFKDGFLGIWNDIKSGLRSILDSMLNVFLNSFLDGMLQGLNGWARQAGSIFGQVFGMGGGAGAGVGGMLSPGVLTAPGAGAGAGAGVGAGVATAGLGVLAGGAAVAQGWMATEWAKAFFGPHYSDQAAQAADARAEAIRMADYTGAAARAGMTAEEFIDSGGVPGFAAGGIVQPSLGGTLARVAEAGRPELIAPLPPGFDLAETLSGIRSMGQGGRWQVLLDGREMIRALVRHLPDEVDRLGAYVR